MSWKVLVTASGLAHAGRQAQELLRRAGADVTFPASFGPLKAGQLVPLLSGHDAVLASLDEYSSDVLNSPSAADLKIIARWGVGYDSIDLPMATRQGIVVTYTPGLLNDAVADYAFALLLALARRVPQADHMMKQGQWKITWGTDLTGKTLGIVGCGQIGLAVAARARAFNMRLLAYTLPPVCGAEMIQFVSLERLLAESDFISLHAALTPQSRGMIGQPQLRQMKSTAFLINTARGALIDEAALAQALSQGTIAGAALDVYTTEPLPAGHPLRSAPNLLLSPHQASFACETGERVSLAAAEAIVDLMQHRQPRNILNSEVIDSPALRARIKEK